MKNTILIHSNYHPNNQGGIEYVVSQLITICQNMGFEVSCFYGGKNSISHTDKNQVHHIQRRILFKIKGACLLSLGNISFFYAALKSKVIIFQEPYPFLWPSLLLLRLFKKRNIIVLVHADPAASPIIKKFYNIARSFIFKKFNLVATSPQLLKKIRFSEKSSVVIPLGIDASINDSKAKFPDSRTKSSYVLYFGRLAEYKGIEHLLEAAQSLPHISFIIAGDGPLASKVHEFIKNNNIKNIQFFNKLISESDKVELIENCTFLVFPSTTENEAFGIVQLEAMRASKAIVNTDLGNGVNFVAPHNICAITCRPKDDKALSEAINYLWSDKELLMKLSENSRERFLTMFTNDRFHESWVHLLQKILE